MRSIQSTLLVRLLAGSAVVLGLAGVLVYFFLARSLEEQFDRNLNDRIQGFASILFQVADEVEFEFSGELMPEFERDEDPAYFELRFADGRLIERSESLGGADLPVEGEIDETVRHWTAPLPDGRSGRYAARLIEVHHVYPEEGPGRPQAALVRVVVARGREELIALERSVLLLCAAVCLILVLVIAFWSFASVRGALEPARRFAATLDAIEVDRLPETLDAGQLPSELLPMAEKTEALMLRLARAYERERRTTAGIAHELRTPISELLTVAEVALRNGRDPAIERTALGTVRDVAWRMGRSVSTLLKLARLDAGSEPFEHGEVDLAEMVTEHLESLAGLRRERGVALCNTLAPGDLVEGDRGVLSIVVSNLLENALCHAPPGGRVACGLERLPGAWRFSVENPAPELCEEDLAALCEPFWRKDKARSDRQRSGLGLALAGSLAAKADLELGFTLEGGVLRASLVGRDGRSTRGGQARGGPRRLHRPGELHASG